MLRAALLQKKLLVKTKLTTYLSDIKSGMYTYETNSHEEIIAVERKRRNLTSDCLLSSNDNTQNLLTVGFDIEMN